MSDESQRHLNVKPLNVSNFAKVNKLHVVDDPIFFNNSGAPTANGLLSNEIFGVSGGDRANTFAQISLGKHPFMHPLMYKMLCKMNGKFRACVHGTSYFKIDSNGQLVEDDNGETGLTFLKKNIDKIKIKSTDSSKRENNIAFLKKYKDLMFIENMVVIPAYFRDINSDGGYVGVGDINKLYNSLIIATKSLSESADYGLAMSDTVRGRIQEILVSIYDWFTDELSGKTGIIRRANNSKTTDYSSRLVLSASNLKVEKIDDLLVDLDHVAAPLSSLCANFYPFLMFYMRRFFENEFANENTRGVNIQQGNTRVLKQFKMKDYQIAFSDNVLKEEIDRFIHGYSNRFRPIYLPLEDTKVQATLRFKGRSITDKQYKDKVDISTTPMQDRDFLWVDLIYMGLCEVIKDKTVLVTRYPIDSMFNQFPTKVNVLSTKLTEPMVVNGTFYKHYPKIRQEQIGINTSNIFIDTLQISNLRIGSMGADFDGDQASVKSVYSVESNAELEAQINSKRNYINLAGENLMTVTNEGASALYSLTLILPEDEKRITAPIF